MSLQDKLQQAKKDQTESNITFNATIAELQEQIAEETKPELRLNDYGFGDSEPIILMENKAISSCYPLLAVSMDGTACGACSKTESATRKLTILGNLDDDLKALQKDVTEFEVAKSFIQRKIAADEIGTHIRLTDSQNDQISIAIGNVPSVILGLRQMEATLKRKQ